MQLETEKGVDSMLEILARGRQVEIQQFTGLVESIAEVLECAGGDYTTVYKLIASQVRANIPDMSLIKFYHEGKHDSVPEALFTAAEEMLEIMTTPNRAGRKKKAAEQNTEDSPRQEPQKEELQTREQPPEEKPEVNKDNWRELLKQGRIRMVKVITHEIPKTPELLVPMSKPCRQVDDPSLKFQPRYDVPKGYVALFAFKALAERLMSESAHWSASKIEEELAEREYGSVRIKRKKAPVPELTYQGLVSMVLKHENNGNGHKVTADETRLLNRPEEYDMSRKYSIGQLLFMSTLHDTTVLGVVVKKVPKNKFKVVMEDGSTMMLVENTQEYIVYNRRQIDVMREPSRSYRRHGVYPSGGD
jgi:hypothetical protein